MGRRTSIEKRELVIAHYKNRKTQKEIAQIMDLSISTVQSIIQRFVRENRVVDKGREAPNKIFTEADERWILRKIKEDPTISAPDLTKEVETGLGKSCNAETIRRIIRKADFHGRTARNKPFISERNKKSRLQFAESEMSRRKRPTGMKDADEIIGTEESCEDDSIEIPQQQNFIKEEPDIEMETQSDTLLTSRNSFPLSSDLDGVSLDDMRNKLLTGEYSIGFKKGVSKAWEFFGIILNENGVQIENYVACRKCLLIIVHNNSTTNMLRHKCYVEKYRNVEPEAKENFERIFLQWTIENFRAVHLIEDAGMKKFLQFLITKVASDDQSVDLAEILPSSSEVRNNIGNLYKKHLENFREESSFCRKMGYAITAGVWSDNYLRTSFLFLIIHYIKNGKLVQRFLGMEEMEGENCTSSDIKESAKEILDNVWLTPDVPSTFVIEKNKNILEAFHSNEHVYCVSHLIETALDAALRETVEIKNICDTTLDLFSALKDTGEVLGETHDIDTRRQWLKIYKLLSTLANNWNEAVEVCKECKVSYLIEKLNFRLIVELVEVLKPFEVASEVLEQQQSPTIHLLIVHLHRLRKLCVKNITDTDVIKKFKVNLLNRFEENVLKNVSMYHKIALYLFPPTNKLMSFSQSDRDLVRDECKRIMLGYFDEVELESNMQAYSSIEIDDKATITEYFNEIMPEEDEDEGPSTSKKPTLDVELFDDFLGPKRKLNSADEKINIEISAYEEQSVPLQSDFDLLGWWHERRAQFPLLYRTSCKVLAVPATSIAAENVIYQARPLVFEEMNSDDWNPHYVNAILFLHNNTKESDIFCETPMDKD